MNVSKRSLGAVGIARIGVAADGQGISEQRDADAHQPIDMYDYYTRTLDDETPSSRT